ncbi:STAS domain-containing protein [Dongia rigui]|uniref:Anti-sigma factor antagonist n=1 Tax=Dongia rigui TaxID=940149 RepID=A0ABU5E2W9_9PROT|nr:STAS domain-containing protein [Dongia rigui]MDY0873947.1 STAS domain-containing protein [Dongia rigui]
MSVSSVREEQGKIVIALEGDIDLENAGEVRKALLANLKQKKDLLIDLSAVTYIDSSGIASLVEGLQVARKQKNELSLVSVSVRARRVLELARLDKVFAIHGDVAAALAARP